MARLTHFLMASEWRAALIASGLLFLPLLSWASASVVALYALRRGLDKSRLVTDEPWMDLRQVSKVSTGVSASGSNTAAAKTEEEGTAAAPTSAVVRYHPKVFGVTAGENLLDAERMGVVQPFLPPTYQVQDARL